MSDAKLATVSIPMWALIVSLVVGTAAGTWAVASEAHNYRLQNITVRIGNHEDSIMANKLDIEHVTTLTEGMADDIAEIKGDVKSLLGAR